MIIVLDTETTGFHPEDGDELLQVSIIEDNREVLFNRYIKPEHHTEWKDAMQVNHITPEMVADAPTVSEVRDELQKIINAADIIIGYNTPFDLRFLDYCADIRPTPGQKIIDTMQNVKEVFGFCKWVKLVEAAQLFGFDFAYHQLRAHDSLADVYATLHVQQCLDYLEILRDQEEEWRLRHAEQSTD